MTEKEFYLTLIFPYNLSNYYLLKLFSESRMGKNRSEETRILVYFARTFLGCIKMKGTRLSFPKLTEENMKIF